MAFLRIPSSVVWLLARDGQTGGWGFTRREARCAAAAVLSGENATRTFLPHSLIMLKTHAQLLLINVFFLHTHTHTPAVAYRSQPRSPVPSSPVSPPDASPPQVPGRSSSTGISLLHWTSLWPIEVEPRHRRINKKGHTFKQAHEVPCGGLVQHFKGPIRGFHHCQAEGNENICTGCSSGGI